MPPEFAVQASPCGLFRQPFSIGAIAVKAPLLLLLLVRVLWPPAAVAVAKGARSNRTSEGRRRERLLLQ